MLDVPFNRDVFCSGHNSLNWDHFNVSLGNDLRNVLFDVFNGIIVCLDDFSRDSLHISSFFVFSDCSLPGDSLNIFSEFVVCDGLFEGDVLNS